jgi:hypothetical protein
MAQAARSGVGRAGELVAALQGWEFPESDIALDDISLRSPADIWPPRIRIDYRIRGRRGRWEETWGDELEDGSVEYGANLMMAIVYAHLMDLTGPPPEHVRAAV